MCYFKTCPRCGAHLDPGETCDCLDIEAELLIVHVGKERTVLSVTSTEGGKVEQIDDPVSTSNDT